MIILEALITFFYLASLLWPYLHFDFDQSFGYLDLQHYWQSLNDLFAKKLIYRDFFWEYGILSLIIQSPFFLFLGKTFLATILIRYFVLPTIAILLSIFLGKQLLKKGPLLLFLFFLLLYDVNNNFSSLRHLLPELGLVMLIVGSQKTNHKKFLLGSFLLSLSLTSSVEYGLAALISAGFYFLITLTKRSFKRVLNEVLRFSTPVVLIAGVYFLFLWKKEVFSNMISFTLQYAQSFYCNSPCRELFPRLNEVNLNLINFLPRLNLYFVPLVLISSLITAIIKRKTKWFSIITPLLIYNLLIFYRTLNTPCLDYMNYGLTFLFLILVFLLFLPKESLTFKRFILVIIIWFLTIGTLTNVTKFFSKPKTPPPTETEFLPIAGIKLKKELTRQYQDIVSFIKENSNQSDYLYVYPNGPYNQLADRKSPVSVSSTWFYDLAPSLVETTSNQLKQRKPKLVVINTLNAWSLKTNLNNLTYNVHSENNEIIFEAITTPVEDFIAQNYKIAKKFKIGWILTEKKETKPVKKLYLPINSTADWNITTQPFIQLTSDMFRKADLIKIPMKVDLGLSKVFSKFIVDIYAKTANNQLFLLNRQLVTSDWQNIWTYLSENIRASQVTSIIVLISDNRGFFWWGKPKNIDFRQPEGFIRNKNLKIDDSASGILKEQ